MQKQNLIIKYLPVEDLIPYARNSRTHSPEQVAQIASSIKEFGFTNPILIDAENGIIAGHGRLQGAQKLGLKEVPTIEVTGWTDARKRAYIIADNKLALNAGWDEEILRLEFEELKDGAFDLELTGFDTAEIDEILDVDISLDDVEEDEAPEPPVVPKSQLGDVWTLGNHRVMCGDSTDAQQVATLMGGEKADMVFTDPPYNTGMTAKENPSNGSTRLTHFFDDSYTDEEWDSFLNAFVKNLHLFMKDDSVAYVCLDWRRNHELMAVLKKHFKVSNVIVWDKVVHGLGSDYKYTYELINVCKKGNPVLDTHQGDREYSDVWHIQRKIGRDDDHATKKPIEVCARPIRHASKKGNVVLDLFGGSGSTLIACEELKRSARLMEFEPNYVDVIITRWQELTGLEAVRQDGVKFNDIVIGE